MTFQFRHHAHAITEHVSVYEIRGPHDEALCGELVLSPEQWQALASLALASRGDHHIDIVENTHATAHAPHQSMTAVFRQELTQ
jgi:hypothetical protein